MVSLHKPTTLPIDLHKRCLMLYAIMIFIKEVWSGLCKLTTYQLLNTLRSFGPTQVNLHSTQESAE